MACALDADLANGVPFGWWDDESDDEINLVTGQCAEPSLLPPLPHSLSTSTALGSLFCGTRCQLPFL
jgi:hypothetical protein